MNKNSVSPLKLFFGFFLAMGWLIPNHYWPWVGFHSDLWVAVTLALYFVACSLLGKARLLIDQQSVIVFGLSLVPVIQYFFGGICFSGDALLDFLYLFGFFLAFSMTGGMSQSDKYQFLDSLFFAIGGAALISVGFQLYQWLGLVDYLGNWLVDLGGVRPSGNFAQPNNLATFLLWGVIALAWGWVRGYLSPIVGLCAAAFLLFGVALTQSRTSVLALILVVLISLIWRKTRGKSAFLWVSLALLAWLLIWLKVTALISPFVIEDVALDRFSDAAVVFKDPIRLVIYKNLLAASLQRPWLGFGFGGVGEAYFSIAEQFPSLGVVVLHTHNLFLDFVIWMGWPLGLLFSVLVIVWFVRQLLDAETAESQVLFLFVFVVVLHAMLELPLHYATFLLPTGLVAGALGQRAITGKVLRLPAFAGVLALCMCTVLMGLIAKDYFLIEERIVSLRLARFNIVGKEKAEDADIVLLDQFSAFLDFSTKDVRSHVTAEDLSRGRQIMTIGFNALNMLHLIEMMVLGGNPDEARQWMKKAPALVGKRLYEDMGRQWAKDGEKFPLLASVEWIPYREDAELNALVEKFNRK